MDFGQFLVLSLLIIVVPWLVSKFFNQLKSNTRQKRLPPSPRKLPFLGNLHQLIGDNPHVILDNLSKQHGPLMFLQLGSTPTLVISSSDVAREIFKPHDLIFSGRPQLYGVKRLSYKFNNISFAPYGEYWREVRKITVLELLSAKRVLSFRSVRLDEVEILINSIVQCSANPVNLSELMPCVSNNVISRVAFGKKYDASEVSNGVSKVNRFQEKLDEMQSLTAEFNVADYYPWLGWVVNKVNGYDLRLEKSFKEMDEFYDEVIKEHLDETRHKVDNNFNEDIVDVLLRLQRDPNQTISLTNDQVKGIITDIFVAGTDTSAATLVWIMTELIRNPSTMKNAQDEVRKVVNGKQKVDESDLPKLTYLKLVIKEVLRMHPPAPLLLPRETTESCTIGDYEIPANTRVIINAKAIGMDSNIWKNPNEFDPERFLDSPIDYKGSDFELIPFGVGRRGCPGINFAAVLVELVLANLLYCFDWSLPEGMTRDDVDMVEAIGVTMNKKEPLLLLATPKFM